MTVLCTEETEVAAAAIVDTGVRSYGEVCVCVCVCARKCASRAILLGRYGSLIVHACETMCVFTTAVSFSLLTITYYDIINTYLQVVGQDV